MPSPDVLGIVTTAKLARHHLHPMLVPFPIALLVATFASDLAFWGSRKEFSAVVALWALGAGIVTAALAAVAGLTDFLGNAAIRRIDHAWHHMIGNVAAVVLSIVSFWLRASDVAALAVVPWGLVLSLLVFLLLLFTGWKGGELVYGQRVGMRPEAPQRRTSLGLSGPCRSIDGTAARPHAASDAVSAGR